MARRLVELSGDQGFQALVVYSVIKNPNSNWQDGEGRHVIRVQTNRDFRFVGN